MGNICVMYIASAAVAWQRLKDKVPQEWTDRRVLNMFSSSSFRSSFCQVTAKDGMCFLKPQMLFPLSNALNMCACMCPWCVHVCCVCVAAHLLPVDPELSQKSKQVH